MRDRSDSLFFFTYPMPYGLLTIQASDKGVTRVVFGEQILEGTFKPNRHTNIAATQLQEYFAGKRFRFDVSLDLEGTVFQKEVWRCVESIPYASTQTCEDIAVELGHSTSHRNVGTAIRANPAPILVPVHRICSKTGSHSASVKQGKLWNALVSLERKHREGE